MIAINVIDGLPYISADIQIDGVALHLDNLLIDTGSMGTAFKTDLLADAGIFGSPNDRIAAIRGAGGEEQILLKRVQSLAIDVFQASAFTIEMAALDYGFPIDGIIGLDFLLEVGAVIDLKHLQLRST